MILTVVRLACDNTCELCTYTRVVQFCLLVGGLVPFGVVDRWGGYDCSRKMLLFTRMLEARRHSARIVK